MYIFDRQNKLEECLSKDKAKFFFTNGSLFVGYVFSKKKSVEKWAVAKDAGGEPSPSGAFDELKDPRQARL
jgi:hypothetical protein